MAADVLYCKFNEKGKKQFEAIERAELESKFPEYTKVGLPAHKAALDGNIECLKDLFSAYGNDGVPSRDVNGATPLHLAVRNSQLDAVKWILRYTTLSALDEAKFGETPVHVAAAQGNLECLKILLSAENKAEINTLATAVDKTEFTVLYLAILKQCNDCAKYLISQLGAKGVGPFNDSGVTAAHIAASAGNVEVLKLISQKFKKYISLPATDGTTPAYHAAQQGQLEALKFLIGKCKCKLTVASEDGAKPIHAAAQSGKTNIVQYIVGQQGNKAVFDHGTDKATPLHYAACNGHIETAEWLLKTDVSGRLISAKDKNGDTPAHDAAENGQTEMLKFLLDAGADLYVINDEGNTPYALALKGDNPETANFVMTEAAKSPKANQQMPQVTIFDLQGDMDVVDVSPQRETALDDTEESLMDKPDKKSKKAAKKKKKRKNSLTSGLEQTLQSFESKQASPKEETEPNDDGPLQFDDGGIELFENSQKTDEDDDIVVRYTNKPGPAVLVTSEYATVNEVAKNEERKQRKKGRKMPKSIQNVLKSGKKKPGEPSEAKKQSRSVFSGLGNIGFKSKSNVNPLLNVRIPPTPPPTPATGASIAPSDEVPQQIVADIEEPESPTQLAKKTSESVPKRKSENSMLLDDTLEHLSSDNSPPDETTDSGSKAALGPQTSYNSKVSSQYAGFAQAKNKFEKFGPTTRQLRSPAGETKGAQAPSDDLSEAKQTFVKLKPTTGKVGSIAAAFSKPNEPPEGNRPPLAKLKPTSAVAKKQPSKLSSGALSESTTEGKTAIVKLKTAAPPAAVSSSVDHKPMEEQSSASQEKQSFTKLKTTAPPASSSDNRKTTEEQSTASLDTSEANNKFVQLKKVQKSSEQVKSDMTELSQIKLKKSTRSTPPRARAVFTKPGTEKASGASNELLKLMKDLSPK